MKKTILRSLFIVLIFVELPDVAAADEKVVINGTQLTAKEIQTLERSY
ncbi:MAG TPA: hypothetical protein VNN78_05050 [Burkholderiales bacterium]|nr:hypothetical protein [Burkholderiales bacterium]